MSLEQTIFKLKFGIRTIVPLAVRAIGDEVLIATGYMANGSAQELVGKGGWG